MDYRKFMDGLQRQYLDYDIGVPKTNLTDVIKVDHMTTPAKMTLINYAASCMQNDEVYLEAGVFRGGTTIVALYRNQCRAVCVDNWSEFQENARDNRKKFLENIAQYNIANRVTLLDGDCEHIISNLGGISAGVYHYDAGHGDVATEFGVEAAFHLLADRALIIIDDTTWTVPRRGRNRLLRKYFLHNRNRLTLMIENNGEDSDGHWASGVSVILYERGNYENSGAL